jgi:hypothetical protein
LLPRHITSQTLCDVVDFVYFFVAAAAADFRPVAFLFGIITAMPPFEFFLHNLPTRGERELNFQARLFMLSS